MTCYCRRQNVLPQNCNCQKPWCSLGRQQPCGDQLVQEAVLVHHRCAAVGIDPPVGRRTDPPYGQARRAFTRGR